MKKLTFILSLLFVALSSSANDDAIKAMIQANSDVEILSFVNDTQNPYLIVGQDSLQAAGNTTISITYQSDWVVQINYTKFEGNADEMYVDGNKCDDRNSYVAPLTMYLPSGKHTITIVRGNISRKNYVVGLGIKKVCHDNEIKAAIQANSDVKILSFENDTLDPWILTDENTLHNVLNYEVEYDDKWNTIGHKRYFSMAFKSDSITKFSYSASSSTQGIVLVVDKQDTIPMGSYDSSVYLTPGEHTVTFIDNSSFDNEIENLSIKRVGDDADIKSMIEARSDVKVEVKNDTFHPWFVQGSDSIVCQGYACVDRDSTILTISYSSDKYTILSFDLNYNFRDTLLIDGKKWHNHNVYSSADAARIGMEPGSHTIQFGISLNNIESEYGSEGFGINPIFLEYVIEHLSIKEVEAFEPINVNVSLESEKETFYDVNADGVLEWISRGKFYGIDWLTFNSYVAQEVSYPSPEKWMDLTNDEYLDGYGYSLPEYFICRANENYDFSKYVVDFHDYYNTLIPLDYNNDGYPDLVSYEDSGDDLDNDRAFTLGRDNGVVENRIKVLTISEYNQDTIRKYHGSFHKTSGIPSLKNGWMILDRPIPFKALLDMNMDINGDGIMDYFYSDILFTNHGDGTVVYDKFPKGVNFVELNGDGVLDGVGFDGTDIIIYTMQKDGTYSEQKIYASAQYTTMWCYDFDKDNDKDLLFAFNYSKTLNGSYIILLENKNGNYVSNEYYYEKHYDFGYCIDHDNDGSFEIVALLDTAGYSGSMEGPICSFDIEGMKISAEPKLFDLNGYYNSTDFSRKYSVLDMDNDGIMELWGGDRQYSGRGVYMQLDTIANEKPNQPQAPSIVYEKSTGLLSITWEQGTDKETSGIDLTYALRIGTEPGKGDIVYADALADGTRRNIMGGNQNVNRYRLLNTNTWKAGKYYISVQTVDPNNRGSLFSEEVIFEKTTHANEFELLYTTPFGVGDTCLVHLHPNILLDTSHYLDCRDGVIVEKSADGLTYKVVFNSVGDKVIALYSNEGGNAIKISEKQLSVGHIPAQTEIAQKAYSDVDLDEDGYMEYYVSGEGYHSYAADGSYAKINKMWNNNASVTSGDSYVCDINKDGKVDVLKQTSFVLNTENKNMSVKTDMTSLPPSTNIKYFVDFNNDGNMDYLRIYRTNYETHYYVGCNKGEYVTFEESEVVFPYQIHDFTNDGLVDILTCSELYKGNGEYSYNYVLYENNGDFSFSVKDTLFEHNKTITMYAIEDFDNDEELDALYCYNSKHYISWGDGTITELNGISSIDVDLRYEELVLFDFNNDGYLDVPAMGGENDVAGILLIQKGHKYEFVEGASKIYTMPFIASDGKLRANSIIIPTYNTKPQAPANLVATQNSKGVMITWEHSQDIETPACRMRYNISVKHKGKTGEGAYLISPCNSTKNGVHVPSTLPLVEGNSFFIPMASIPIGEYEIQVQGVDMHQWESDFSEVFNLVVDETIAIDAPVATGVGVETAITVLSNIDSTIDWNGGDVIDTIGNQYLVVWDSVGVKTIVAGEYKQSIVVKPLPNASFVLPEEVMQLAIVNVTAHDARSGQWSISSNELDFVPFVESELVDMLSVGVDTVVLRFNQAGTYMVRRTIAGKFGDGVFEQRVNVTDEIISPEILSVTNIDGHYQIHWSALAEDSDVIGYRLYKETSYAGVYDFVADINPDATEYADFSSNPNVHSSRYALSYITTYGESVKSTPHQGLHVMINRGVGSTWNLAWMKCEGRTISQYRIWRGTTIDNLEIIGEISGNMTSFSDVMTEDSVNYYAVEVVFAEREIEQLPVRRNVQRLASVTSMSNVVSTKSAHEVSFVETIDVQGKNIVAGENIISQLIAYIYPYYASYKAVNWVIEEGEDFADIDANGFLSVDGLTNGDVVVRAYALDGSNVYGETTINVSGFRSTYTITYIVDGKIWQTQTYKVGDKIKLLEEPEKEGYIFSGWSDVPDTMPANDIEVYGHFEAKEPVSVDSILLEGKDNIRKVLIDGHIYILIDGKIYSIMGREIEELPRK